MVVMEKACVIVLIRSRQIGTVILAETINTVFTMQISIGRASDLARELESEVQSE